MPQAERMFALFRGMSKAHGTYREEEYNEDKGKQEIKKSARTLRSPPTVELWQRHLDGKYHLGIITICEDSTVWWGAVDIDDYQVDHAALVEELAGMALPCVVCRTKSGGAHIYLFFSEPIPAGEVMRKLRELAVVLGRGSSEVFPKQDRMASELEGLGNWINMPYYDAADTKCYGVRPNGMGMSLDQFLATAEKSQLTHAEFRKLKFRRRVEGWDDGPPCLEHLASVRLRQGHQNSGMFSFGVLAKKKFPDKWEERLREWNRELCDPVHPEEGIATIIKSLRKRDYNYKCHDQPCVLHCNMALCRQRQFGIGPGGSADIIDSVSILDTDPPLFYVLLKTGGTVETDATTLLNPRSFQNAAMEQLRLVLPQYRQENWLPQVQKAVEGATMIEMPPEVGTTGQFHELVERFCTDRHAAESREDILQGKPWRSDSDGVVWFRLRDLAEFLDRNKFSKLKSAQVANRIREMGGRTHFFNLSGKGVNVWGMPLERLTWVNGELRVPEVEVGPV